MTAGAGRVALLTFVLSLAMFLANGRAIGSGDTNASEKTAASLVTRGTLVLTDPGEGASDPFTRAVPGGRVSIYPALPSLLAAPFFFIFGLFFELNASGIQIAGKVTAALVSAIATALMAGSFARRTSGAKAVFCALVFGVGTSVYSTSQALWQHPSAVLFLVIALRALERVESRRDGKVLPEALVAALSLGLCAASRPAAIPMCAVLFLFLMFRAKAHAGWALVVASLPALLVAFYNITLFGAPWRFGQSTSGRFFAAFPESIAGLLVSPARGLLIFTPIALLAIWGLTSQAKRQVLARALLAATLTHVLFISLWNEWHGGESSGPRLLTDMLPALFFYLPEALTLRPVTGLALGLASITIQLVGGWTYDYRWERLHQRGQDFDAALWSWRDSPIAFALREGVVIQGRLTFESGRLRLPVRRFVPFGPKGSTIEATATGLRVSGPELLRDIRLERGGRVTPEGVTLSHPADALVFRLDQGGVRELRLTGSLHGTIGVDIGLGSAHKAVSGPFDFTLPIQAERGADLFVRAESGELRLTRVSLK